MFLHFSSILRSILMLYIIPDSKRINTGELLMNGSLPLEVYENLDSIFDRAEFVDGMPVPQINEAVREIFNSDQESGVPFAVTRAKMLAFTLQHIRIAINASGKFAGVVERDYLSNRYETSAIRFIQWERYDKIAREEFPDIYNRNKTESEKGTSVAALDLSHTCPDWERILTLGATGLLQLAEEKYDKNPSVFNESVLIAYRAFRDFIVRFAGIAEKHGRSDLAGILSGLARHAPQTLHEALQLSLLYFHVQEIEGEWVRSFGLFDRQFLPFFEKDMLCGRLTEESAEELLIHYFSFFHAESKGKDAGTAICFGGLLPGNDTEDGCNKLTYLAWQAFRKLGNPTPKFSLRVNPYTPDEILDFAAQCIQEGQNSMVFANEPLIRKAFLQQGKDRHDLANFVPIGCYEPAIMGKELSCTMTCDYNLAKPAELIFDDKTFSPSSFEEVEKYYFELLCSTLTDVMSRAVEYEKMWNKVNPSPILSGTMKECMERDLDVSEYGTKYATSGVMCAGLATAVDSLMAIKTMVFDRKMLSFDELRQILANDWQGHEELQLFAGKRSPKWGCGNPEADRIGKKICDTAADLINNTSNAKGGRYQMGLWSIYYCLIFGQSMKATADGRHAGTTVSKNSGCTAGCDSEGIAGLFESLAKVDHSRFPDGAVLDVMLSPAATTGTEGRNYITNLVKTFFANGGMFIHFNILSLKQLQEAQIHPEKYRNLQVRLCGWNVRFIDLSKEHQDWLIHEAEGK